MPEWFEPTKNISIRFQNDDGLETEVYFNFETKSWFQSQPYMYPEFLDKLLKLLTSAQVWGMKKGRKI